MNYQKEWLTTENLNLDFFDYIYNTLGGSYYLKKKKSNAIYHGHYDPETKSFEAYKLNDNHKKIIKRENVAFFIVLPPLDFKVSTIIKPSK